MAPKKKQSRALVPTQARALSAKEFLDLADVPPEIEWFANITNPQVVYPTAADNYFALKTE